MRFTKQAITIAAVLGVGATSLGLAAPAIAASPTTPASKPAITVKIDKADHEAKVTTKRGTFTVNWEAIRKGKVDLVTVHNDKGALVAARHVPAKRVDRILTAAAKHPGAIRKLWVRHHAKHAKANPKTTATK